MDEIKAGDKFTIAGLHRMERNSDRRWWQFWRPKMIAGPELQSFRITNAR